MKPHIIEGGIHVDERGRVRFVNQFDFSNIGRFYIIENSMENAIRGWQAHKIDEKNFMCIEGSFIIYYLRVDDWENPSTDLKPESIILSSKESKIFHIPGGYATAIKSLQSGSKLISLSSLSIKLAGTDSFRFPLNTWKIDEQTII